MLKITADEEGNVSIGIDGTNESSELFAEFGCIVLAFMRTMEDMGKSDITTRTLHMVTLAIQQFNK